MEHAVVNSTEATATIRGLAVQLLTVIVTGLPNVAAAVIALLMMYSIVIDLIARYDAMAQMFAACRVP